MNTKSIFSAVAVPSHHRILRAFTALFLIAVPGLAVPGIAGAPPPRVDIWTAHSLARIRPDDPPGPASGQEVRIAAAGGEQESFQVALRSSGGDVAGVTAEVSDLSGPAGTIARDRMTLYREHFVYVRQPSPRSSAPPGLYPDALLPFVDPASGTDIPPRGAGDEPKGAKYDAAPFDLHDGCDEVLWVDVGVPADAKPGSYRGELTVRGRGLEPRRMPIALEVRGFALPRVPAVKTHFGGFRRAARWHGLKPGDEAFRPIEERYCESFALHRLAPPVPGRLRPEARPDGSIDPSKTHAGLKEFMERYRVNSYGVERPPYRDPLGAGREKALRFLRETGRYLAENGWLDGAYAYWMDEPNDAGAYEEVRRWGALVHESGSRIPFLVTEQTKGSDPAWGDLHGAVDIWVPLWPLHDPATATERLAKGERLWSYTALCQGSPETPWWQIDFPPLHYRVPLWQSWLSRMEGLLYWEAVFWDGASDPWLDEPSFRGAYCGEGALIYPGKDAGIDGPVPSIRLKNLRDGMEDFEYLAILAKAAGREAADAMVRKVARSWFDWEKDPEKLLEAREEIEARIEAERKK